MYIRYGLEVFLLMNILLSTATLTAAETLQQELQKLQAEQRTLVVRLEQRQMPPCKVAVFTACVGGCIGWGLGMPQGVSRDGYSFLLGSVSSLGLLYGSVFLSDAIDTYKHYRLSQRIARLGRKMVVNYWEEATAAYRK